jgi:hypothetical protein
MCATCPTQVILPECIALIIFSEEYNYGTPHYAILYSVLLLTILRFKYSPPLAALN